MFKVIGKMGCIGHVFVAKEDVYIHQVRYTLMWHEYRLRPVSSATNDAFPISKSCLGV